MPSGPLCAGMRQRASSPAPREASLPRLLTPTSPPRVDATGGLPTSAAHRAARWWRHPGFAVGLPLALGLLHVALVAPHYFVGSFDDDAGYILAGRALLAGLGLNGHLASGVTVAGSFPPGYSALLAPLLWIWPHTFVPLRMLSLVCYIAIFPLTWVYLGRRQIGDGARTATLTLLALGPPLATYATMVMAETPFLVLLLVLLLLVDRWEPQPRVFTGTGLAVILAAGGLVWLKEAGIGVVVGLALWLLVARRPASGRKAAAVLGGTAVLLLPVALARLIGGIPLAGSRYSVELGGYFHGGLIARLLHVAPRGLWQMLSTALPATLVPYLGPLPIHGHAPDLWKVLSWQVTLLVAVGAVVWARRHRDAAVVVVPVYLAETLLWPYVNERRVILVLPVLAAWYVLGAVAVWKSLRSWVTARRARLDRRGRPGVLGARGIGVAAGALAVGLVVIGPLAVQLPRDYLVGYGQDTSHFEGSPYVQILTRLGQPADVVETDYLSSTALFTGHATAWTAFLDTVTGCDLRVIRQALASDRAAFLLLGAVNKPGVVDRPCLLAAASANPWAVRLLHTNRDNASVFELIGPGTGHPDLRDLTAGLSPTRQALGPGRTGWEWDWAQPRAVTQVSVGAAGRAGSTSSISLQVRGADGVWHTEAAAASSVGDGAPAAPYLLATLPPGSLVSAVRVVITATPVGPDAAASVPLDVHALGPGAGP
jgi:hypothetical protein